jgi:hypothetical protein
MRGDWLALASLNEKSRWHQGEELHRRVDIGEIDRNPANAHVNMCKSLKDKEKLVVKNAAPGRSKEDANSRDCARASFPQSYPQSL